MIVIREPSAHRKLREFDGSRSMSAIPEFRESAAEMADRIRAQLRMRFGCDEEDFEERMERQWEIEKRVRRSIEERQTYAPATFGSVSRNAEKLLQTLKDRKKFLEGQIRCSSGPVFAPEPIEVRPHTSLSMSMRSSFEISPATVIIETEEKKIEPSPKKKVAFDPVLGMPLRKSQVRLSSVSELVYPDGHSSPAVSRKRRQAEY